MILWQEMNKMSAQLQVAESCHSASILRPACALREFVLCTAVRALVANRLISILKFTSIWWDCWMTSKKRPRLKRLKGSIARFGASTSRVDVFWRDFTRYCTAASNSCNTSCWAPGSFPHLSLRSESIKDKSSRSSNPSKNCLACPLGMSKVTKLAKETFGALGVKSTNTWRCAKLWMAVASTGDWCILGDWGRVRCPDVLSVLLLS